MVGDKARIGLEHAEGGGQCGITLLGGLVEAVVRGPLLRRLPNAFDRVELR